MNVGKKDNICFHQVGNIHKSYITMKRLAFAIIIITINFACNNMNNEKNQLEELKNVDREFCNYSKKHGMPKAFIEFAHDSGILLQRNSYPIIGKKEIGKRMAQIKEGSFTLEWEPMNGEVAKSGELGFTYGTYTSKTKDITTRGTYVSVWKKDKSGKWKYILDSGNEGLGEKKETLK